MENFQARVPDRGRAFPQLGAILPYTPRVDGVERHRARSAAFHALARPRELTWNQGAMLEAALRERAYQVVQERVLTPGPAHS